MISPWTFQLYCVMSLGVGLVPLYFPKHALITIIRITPIRAPQCALPLLPSLSDTLLIALPVLGMKSGACGFILPVSWQWILIEFLGNSACCVIWDKSIIGTHVQCASHNHLAPAPATGSVATLRKLGIIRDHWHWPRSIMGPLWCQAADDGALSQHHVSFLFRNLFSKV